MELLRVENLVVETSGEPRARVLNGVSLGVGRGEVHVLFGPNGAGKSTLLKAIMGLPQYRVVEGRVVFEGKDITKAKPYERAAMGIAMAYQAPPAVPVRLGYLAEKLVERFGGDLRDVSSLELEHLLDRNLHEGFSGGESKRVELGLTLLQRPKLAMLDEPDSGVDVDSLERVAEVVKELAERGTSLLIVTHLGHIAQKLEEVDAAYVMVGGRIVLEGDFEEVYEAVMRHGYKKLSEAMELGD